MFLFFGGVFFDRVLTVGMYSILERYKGKKSIQREYGFSHFRDNPHQVNVNLLGLFCYVEDRSI